MNKKQIGTIAYKYSLIILILAAIAYRGGRDFIFQKQQLDEHKVAVTIEDIKQVYPAAADYSINRHGVYEAYNKQGKPLGLALLSPNYSRQYGYAGYVPLLIGVDDELVITKIALLPNNETKDYTRAVYSDKFMSQWQGLSLEGAAEHPVDAVSGATITSEAVIAGIRQTAAAVMESDTAEITETGTWTTVKDILFLILLLLSLVLAFKKGLTRYRSLYLVMVVVIMGLLLNKALSMLLLNGWLLNGFSWQANWQTVTVLLLALLVSFAGKRQFYCNYLCPMGALQELTNRFTPFKTRALPTRFKGVTLREVYLILIAGALILGFSPELSYLEPFMFFSFRIAGIGLIIFGVVVILLSLFLNRPWCALCPTGCFLDTISYKKVKQTKSSS